MQLSSSSSIKCWRQECSNPLDHLTGEELVTRARHVPVGLSIKERAELESASHGLLQSPLHEANDVRRMETWITRLLRGPSIMSSVSRQGSHPHEQNADRNRSHSRHSRRLPRDNHYPPYRQGSPPFQPSNTHPFRAAQLPQFYGQALKLKHELLVYDGKSSHTTAYLEQLDYLCRIYGKPRPRYCRSTRKPSRPSRRRCGCGISYRRLGIYGTT